MPLNHELGEPIDGLPSQFRVVPNTKWRETQMFEQAATIAAEAFFEKGALLPVTFDDREVVTQEFWTLPAIVFVFCKKIRGEEFLSVRKYDIPPDMMRELRANGLWEAKPPFN